LTRFRLLFAFSVLAVLATALVACGGGGSESPQDVINKTFGSGHDKVTSADINLSLKADASGPQGGTVDASLTGPFESQGSGNVPKLDIQVKLNATTSSTGKNTNFEGGLTSTGSAAYVNYKGSDYQLPGTILSQYKQLLQQATSQQQNQQQSSGAILKQLGISNPQDLLTNLKDEGDADVEGTSTQHVSGDLDVNKVVDALKSAISNVSALQALGGSSTQLPSASQLDQVKGAIKTAHFDLYSGKDDHILRRLTIALKIVPPAGTGGGAGNVDVTFDITLGKVNESQNITAPSGAKPLSALLTQLGVNPASLGALGALGGVPGSGIVGKGTPTTPPSGVPNGTNAAQAQKYLNCVSKASSAADLQACSSLAP
jgi:hypothetical protein